MTYVQCWLLALTVKPLTTDCTLGDVRLAKGNSELEGRVEVCFGKLWGTICHNSWDNRDAGVICKQLFNSSFGELPYSGKLSREKTFTNW